MGRRIRSTSIDYGRNPDVFVPSDRENVRCSKCGFICNLTREPHSEEGSRIGYGITYVHTTAGGGTSTFTSFSETVAFSGSTSFDGDVVILGGLYDPVVVSGCPFCGTMLYNK